MKNQGTLAYIHALVNKLSPSCTVPSQPLQSDGLNAVSITTDSRTTVIAMMTGFIGFIVGVIVALLAVTLVFTAVLCGCKTQKTQRNK